MTVLVLHDCDVDGCNIADGLRRGTRRSPQPLRVVDQGLNLRTPEPGPAAPTRDPEEKALPAGLEGGLDEEPRAFLGGARRPGQRLRDAQRVELNAFTSEALVAHIEAKLQAHGLAEKVCPPPAVVAAEAGEVADPLFVRAVRQDVDRVLGTRGLSSEAGGDAPARPNALRARLVEKLADNPPDAWQAILASDAAANPAAVSSAVGDAVRAASARTAASETGAAPAGGTAV